MDENFKYVRTPSKINKNKKLSIENFNILFDEKLAKLQASIIFSHYTDKELKYLERKKIISIKEDYIYERNFPKVLYRTLVY